MSKSLSFLSRLSKYDFINFIFHIYDELNIIYTIYSMLVKTTQERVFDKYGLFLLEIDEDDLMSFLIKMDIDDKGKALFPLEILTDEIMNVIPEYVFAEYQNTEISKNNAVELLRKAAKSIYRIPEFELMRKVCLEQDENAKNELGNLPYKNRGEFGELLLHFILRDFKGTIPLVSKVYFKDSAGIPAHGFDAVHISPNEKILWLGESKLYKDGKQGVTELVNDLQKHLQTDYLNEQFEIIKKNLYNNTIPERDKWIKTLDETGILKDKLKFINIPMLCTYTHDIYTKFEDTESSAAVDYHKLNARELKNYFDTNNKNDLTNQCNIILILLPIKDKKELVTRLHEKLWCIYYQY